MQSTERPGRYRMAFSAMLAALALEVVAIGFVLSWYFSGYGSHTIRVAIVTALMGALVINLLAIVVLRRASMRD